MITAQQQYDIDSSAALTDLQAGRISFSEWNRRQKAACEKYNAAKEKDDRYDSQPRM
jgi:hypothetical protein